MSYVIFGDLFTFPEGDASTNRVHYYAKGFRENGKNVHVVCFGNTYTNYTDGELDGIKYYHPFGQSRRSSHFIKRTYLKISKFIKTYSLFKKIQREDGIKLIIVYTAISGTLFYAWFLSRLTGSKLIREVSEHPLRYYQDGTLRKVIGKIKLKAESNCVDGILCISHYLINFFKDVGIPQHRLLLVPSTVDPARFSINIERPLPFRYIGYFGNLTFNRDNVDVLVEAFSLIAKKYPSINLVMGGPGHDNDRTKIKKLAFELNISDRVILLDYLPREEIKRYILNSDILVMVRANDMKSQASFPSKLTEYLATSKPVISVNVGEVSMFLTDGLNAFIVDPGNINKLAQKIDTVLSGYDVAKRTAERGKHLVETVFNYQYQARRIIPFVESLYKL
ncbi:MAG TPA: glycosyltransferase family 4 protein [Bacteroidales bacterium]|nr:glycosyltransferase family 4 protein [Bacteroidales bacterium]